MPFAVLLEGQAACHLSPVNMSSPLCGTCNQLYWLANAWQMSLQVLELTQGQKVEVEILTLLVNHLQEVRQQQGLDGKEAPGKAHSSSSLVLLPIYGTLTISHGSSHCY